MFAVVKRLWSSTSERAHSAFSRANTVLRQQGFTNKTVLLAMVFVLGLGLLAPLEGSNQTMPPAPEAAVYQVVPTPSLATIPDPDFVSGKLEIDLSPIQKMAEKEIANSGEHVKRGDSTTLSNVKVLSRGDHVDANFDLYVQHKTSWWSASSRSKGPVVVQIRPYYENGYVGLRSHVEKVDMTKIGGVSNIRDKVKSKLRAKFEEKVDRRFRQKLPEGAKIHSVQFNEMGNGPIKMTIEFSMPLIALV